MLFVVRFFFFFWSNGIVFYASLIIVYEDIDLLSSFQCLACLFP